MKKRFKISDIPSLINKPALFDANVIIYIFWPTGSKDFESKYSSIFAELLKQNTKIYINFIVISEVVNRAIRIEYEKYLLTNNFDKNRYKYKDFRDSLDGQEVVKDVYQVIQKKVVSTFEVIGKIFTKDEIISFLNVDKLDFCDKAIEMLCKENNLVLVTNDSDFINSDLEILTANSKLLNSK
jgi:predicted nucleic acid-binding protein